MKSELINASFVCLANYHNPSILSTNFLEKSGIIKSYDEVILNSVLVTPPLSQVIFNNNSILTIENERLKIDNKSGDDPFVKGQLYCKSLPHIKCIAIGFNYAFYIIIPDSFLWFSQFENYVGLESNQISFIKKDIEGRICNLKITKTNIDHINVDFNFHYDLNNKTLGEITLDFISESKNNVEVAQKTISSLFSL